MNLIPQPQEITYKDSGTYLLPQEAVLLMPVPDSRLTRTAGVILPQVQTVGSPSGLYALCCGDITPLSKISVGKDLPDAYELSVTANGLYLRSHTAAGLFYGLQTLRQLIENYGDKLPFLEIRDWAFTSLRCDHYDLRTVYPVFHHMLDYITDMAQYKINALLIEYEDKLPFTDMKELRHPHGLTSQQLRQLLDTAYEHFIEIIPLQQSYGHLEYVLKHPDYIDLREQPDHVAELCPQNPRSFDLICNLIRDMATLHPHSRYLHLGGDEVWSIGTCDACKTSGLSNTMIFIQFINKLAAFTIQLGKQPIIWHDMLKDATDAELEQLDKRITVAVWIYSGRHIQSRATSLVCRFQNAGLQVLGAPSVRCWDECAAQNYPIAERRLENISAWTNVLVETKLKGLIFTNWSASLALGNPYGLFESTRYLTFFACEQAWNPHASQDTYPKHFFSLYHGVTDAAFLEEDFSLTDYYKIPEQYFPLAGKNKLTAQLLDVMRQYEVAIKSGLPLQDLLFLGDLFPENEEIVTFLKEKYNENYEIFDQLYPVIQQLLEELLPHHLVKLYLHSRFYLPDMYRSLAKKMLDL